jgi:hypothetical protein
MFDGFANTQDDWIARVNATIGIEMLFASDWRLLAASQRVWDESGQRPEDHVGKSLWDYPFLRPGRAGLDGLGLFDGRTLSLKLSIELNFNGRARTRDLDFCPVMIDDGTILVHLTGVSRAGTAHANPDKPAFRILDIRTTPAAARETEAM